MSSNAVEDTHVTAAAAAADTTTPPMTAEQTLLHMLRDVDAAGPRSTRRLPLQPLQRACMKVPHLSTVLDGALRYRLYMQVLFDDDKDDDDEKKASDARNTTTMSARTARLSRLPSAFADYADRAIEAHTALARQLARVLRDDGNKDGSDGSDDANKVDDDSDAMRELRGFVYYLASQTAAYVNDEFAAIVVTMATLVRDAHDEATATVMAAVTTPSSSPRHALLVCVYDVAVRVLSDYGASNTSRLYDATTRRLLSLLLQYHDPALSVHLDQHKVDAGVCLLRWTRSLFAVHGGYRDALAILDWVFVLGDAVMLPYVALAYLITHRGRLLALTSSDALDAQLCSTTLSLPHDKAAAVDPHLADGRPVALVPVWSGKSLLQNAELLYRSTPLSSQRVLDFCLHPDGGSVNQTPDRLAHYYAAAPCIPLERADLLDSFAPVPVAAATATTTTAAATTEAATTRAAVEYIVIDCRSRDSYDYARLPTAVFVGDVVGYDAQTMDEVVARVAAVRGAHLTVFGTGRPLVEEQNLLKMLVFHLVMRRYPHVSITLGGFRAAVPLLRARRLRMQLSSAASHELLQQQQHAQQQEGTQHTTTSSAAADGEGSEATSARHVLASALSTLGDYVATRVPVTTNTDAVKQHAEELRSKAKEGVAVASSWGMSLLQRAQERIAEVRAAHEAAVAASAQRAAGAASTTTAGGNNNNISTATGGSGIGVHANSVPSSATAAAGAVVRSPVRGPVLQGKVTRTTTAATSDNNNNGNSRSATTTQPTTTTTTRPLFSLGDDDDDDDLGLITSVPVGRPLKGVLDVDATQPSSTATTAAPAAPQADVTSAVALPAVPTSSNSAHGGGSSSSNLAADIDAEFEELFGSDSAPVQPQ